MRREPGDVSLGSLSLTSTTLQNRALQWLPGYARPERDAAGGTTRRRPAGAPDRGNEAAPSGAAS
ncbi:hypothetical protein BJQ90_01014 [Arthrobacter sp. SO3]|nr:hypothetical protein [Arthrobacter sp. SO3]